MKSRSVLKEYNAYGRSYCAMAVIQRKKDVGLLDLALEGIPSVVTAYIWLGILK